MSLLRWCSANRKPVLGAVGVDSDMPSHSLSLSRVDLTDFLEILAFEVLFDRLDKHFVLGLVLDAYVAQFDTYSHTYKLSFFFILNI